MRELSLDSPSLAQLQQRFALGLQQKKDALACSINDDREITASERLRIYQNNFTLSLTELLSATYPAVEKLVGEECFKTVARFHVLHNPLVQADVSFYGAEFDASLAKFKEVIQTCPYVTELARLEWEIDLSRQDFDNAPNVSNCLTLDKLSEISEQQHALIQFCLAPSVLLLQSEYSVFSLRTALLETDTHRQQKLIEQLNVNQFESGFIITLENNQNHIAQISSSEYELLQAFKQHKSLHQISTDLLTQLQPVLSRNLVSGFNLNNQ
jgi:hypothetical protein